MSGAKHSPAPWWHDEAHCAIRYRLPSGHPDLYSDDPELDDGARNVVSLIGACGGTDSAADVALMAAAPELLAALRVSQAALAMLTEPQAIRTTTVSNAWAQAVEAEQKARLAIAKAEARDA